MTDLLAQAVPSGTWTAVAGCRGVRVYQQTGEIQHLVLAEDGTLHSLAGPIWDLRIEPQGAVVAVDPIRL